MEANDGRVPVSVGILTLNSAENLPRALESVSACSDVYICDGNSTDGTQDIARAHGARVVKQVDTDEPNQRVTDFGEARTKCLHAAHEQWYFRLDSDEYLSSEAVDEIRNIVTNPNPPFLAYKIPRKYVWRGTVIDDTITYPNRQPRLFRRDAIIEYTKKTHERPVLKDGVQYGIMSGVMFAPLPDTFDELDIGRTKRALEWDKRHYEATMTPTKWLWAVLHTSATFALFGVRMIRVRLISRGNKLPISLELWRFKYLLSATWLATTVMVRKLFR